MYFSKIIKITAFIFQILDTTNRCKNSHIWHIEGLKMIKIVRSMVVYILVLEVDNIPKLINMHYLLYSFSLITSSMSFHIIL